MAGLKKLSTRIINKHATAAVWNETNFTPLQGEIVVYDPGYDSKDGKTYIRERMKIGDGKHTIQELHFVNELDVNASTTKNTLQVVTSTGDAQYTPAQHTAPSMGQTLENELLEITFNAGSYSPASFIPGAPTTTTINYIEDVTVTTEQPL